MSNTPRTDAAAVDLGKVTVPINGEWVGAPFARQLERELIAYKGHLAAAETQLQEAWAQVASATDAPRSATAATDRPDWAQQLPGAELYDRAARYEYIRTLNPRKFSALYNEALMGVHQFDDLVDRYRMKGEPVECGYNRTGSLNEGRYVCTCGACMSATLREGNK